MRHHYHLWFTRWVHLTWFRIDISLNIVSIPLLFRQFLSKWTMTLRQADIHFFCSTATNWSDLEWISINSREYVKLSLYRKKKPANTSHIIIPLSRRHTLVYPGVIHSRSAIIPLELWVNHKWFNSFIITFRERYHHWWLYPTIYINIQR